LAQRVVPGRTVIGVPGPIGERKIRQKVVGPPFRRIPTPLRRLLPRGPYKPADSDWGFLRGRRPGKKLAERLEPAWAPFPISARPPSNSAMDIRGAGSSIDTFFDGFAVFPVAAGA